MEQLDSAFESLHEKEERQEAAKSVGAIDLTVWSCEKVRRLGGHKVVARPDSHDDDPPHKTPTTTPTRRNNSATASPRSGPSSAPSSATA